MRRTIAAAFAIAALAGPAFAQSATSPPPEGPTLSQCNAGYKDGMKWSRSSFATACEKLKEKNKGK